jgi:hypothetical protein
MYVSSGHVGVFSVCELTLKVVKTPKKINTINKFSNPELEYFFTNRYNPNFNSSKN